MEYVQLVVWASIAPMVSLRTCALPVSIPPVAHQTVHVAMQDRTSMGRVAPFARVAITLHRAPRAAFPAPPDSTQTTGPALLVPRVSIAQATAVIIPALPACIPIAVLYSARAVALGSTFLGRVVGRVHMNDRFRRALLALRAARHALPENIMNMDASVATQDTTAQAKTVVTSAPLECTPHRKPRAAHAVPQEHISMGKLLLPLSAPARLARAAVSRHRALRAARAVAQDCSSPIL